MPRVEGREPRTWRKRVVFMGRGVSNLLHQGWAQKHIWDSTWYVEPDPGMGGYVWVPYWKLHV